MIKVSNVLLIIITTILFGCNGHSSQRYYKNFKDNHLSKSLDDEYEDLYGFKWKEYRKNGVVKNNKELFARDDYISKTNYHKTQTTDWDLNNKNRKSKEYCVYSLSYFIPLNFWNLRFNDEQYIRKAIRDLNKNNISQGEMENIEINDNGIGTPLYSYFCIAISGGLKD